MPVINRDRFRLVIGLIENVQIIRKKQQFRLIVGLIENIQIVNKRNNLD
jgi:hypothetical protein